MNIKSGVTKEKSDTRIIMSLTSELVVFTAAVGVLLLKVLHLETEALELAINAHVLTVEVLQLRRQLLHTTAFLCCQLLGLLHALSSVVGCRCCLYQCNTARAGALCIR